MANHDSAVKKHRQDEKKRMVNRINRSKMKNKIKALKKKVSVGQRDEAAKLLPDAIAIIDMTVRKGTIHKNTGSRYKSRLLGLLNKSEK
ncbi:MAG: 30S ribosomal protein S20 [Acidobacteria bacterium]|jgi:small subunit ribosomal protein S20|nr:30S ribosomal protein S20 [Acidobacteriota bacterium]